ncbi:MAG TPA: RDD family protein [Gaiellales bacterium]|jgi:uncharacterized RDD family membrane protein YckC|nr:RDD family protein [Gaiellales bacterium]
MSEPTDREQRPGTRRRHSPGLTFAIRQAGATATRVTLLPLRVARRAPGMGWVVSQGGAQVAGRARATRAYGEARLEDAAGEMLGSRGVERAVGRAFEGPLPEHVANAIVEQRVVQRVVAEVLANVDMEAAITAALERERAEGRLEQIVGEAARSQAAEEITQRVVSSPELQRLIEEVIASDAVRTALARQTASFGSEVAGEVRRRSRRIDDRIAVSGGERSQQDGTMSAVPSPYAGLLGRFTGGAIDLALMSIVFLGGAAMVGVLSNLVGGLRPSWLEAAIASVGSVLVAAIYLMLFWTVAGQTPGMRVMGLRLVVGRDGNQRPGAGRALLRVVALAIAIVPFFAGFLPVLFDGRRRAIQDMLAGTVVRLDDADEGG